jgi:hypothetical protein
MDENCTIEYPLKLCADQILHSSTHFDSLCKTKIEITMYIYVNGVSFLLN